MLVIKTELWSYGFEELAKPIGQTRIWNVGGSKYTADYNYSHNYPGVPHLGIPEILDKGAIDEHDRNLPLPELYRKVFNEFQYEKFYDQK